MQEQQGKHFCGCGCGEPILLRPEHFPNVPRFVHGHNVRLDSPRKPGPPAPRNPCGCGCGNFAAPRKRFLRGHHRLGQTHSEEARRKISESGKGRPSANWGGGLTRTNTGYIRQWAPAHPFASNRYVPQHRLIMEAHLRTLGPDSDLLRFTATKDDERYLHPKADIHHINEVKDDNRLENLEVLWRGDHSRHHLAMRQQERALAAGG